MLDLARGIDILKGIFFRNGEIAVFYPKLMPFTVVEVDIQTSHFQLIGIWQVRHSNAETKCTKNTQT